MESIEQLLKRIKSDAKRLGVYFKSPLSHKKNLALAAKLKQAMNIEIPEDYLALLRVTNGIQTQNGYLSDLEEIIEQNTDIWFMDSKAGAGPTGDFEIRLTPRKDPPIPTYLWLGYEGNVSKQVYDLKLKGFLQLPLGWDDGPFNKDHSLAGLLRYLVYGDE